MYLGLRKAAVIMPIIIVILVLLNIPMVSASTIVEKQKEIEKIQEEIANSKAALDKATSYYQKTLSEAQAIDEDLRKKESELTSTQDKLATLKTNFNKRVVHAYKTGPTNFFSVLAFSQDFGDFIARASIVSYIVARDNDMIKELRSTGEKLTQQKLELAKVKKEKDGQLKIAETINKEINHQLALQNAAISKLNREITTIKRAQNTRYAMATSRASQDNRTYVSRGNYRSGFVFPVDGPHSYIDSWGHARSGGRKHKGTDIMAAKGTPVVACVSGVISKTSPHSRGLGGITLWLEGDDGNTYYYAHLNNIAGGIAPGARVSAGQLVGTVGSTGNASASAPHLHFEIHPGGGAAINPYPILRNAQN